MSVMKKNKTILISLLVMLLWGLLFPLVKLGYQAFGITAIGDTMAFAGMRFLVCGAVITVVACVKNPGCLQGIKENLLPILVSGLFAVTLHYGLSYTGLLYTDGSKTAILKQLGAIFYICFAALFFPEDKLNPQKVIGLVCGLLGILVINLNGGSLTFHFGDLLILVSSFCLTFSMIISKKALKKVEPIALTGVSQFFGGAVIFVAGLCAGGNAAAVIPKNLEQTGIFCAIMAASIASYCLWYMTVQKENLSKLFIIKFAEPLFAAFFSWILLGENIFRLEYLLAFLLISIGITIANRKHTDQKAKQAK